MKSEKLVVGLDVGTTSVRALVGEVDRRGGPLTVLGAGAAMSRGIRKGVITNIEAAAEAIREAVREAEAAAGVDIKAVHIGITGGHIGCISSQGVIAVKEREIGRHEVDSVIDAAKAVALPFDREMLHVIPAGFTVNGQNGITDPRGMAGVRLETDVQIITCAATSMQNLLRSCQRAGLHVIDIIYQPLASAGTVLRPDEKELGVAVVDIGGGTTDMALFYEGTVCHASVLTIGGNNFTNDVAVGLRVPAHDAEILKRNHGCALLSMVRQNEEIEAGMGGGRLHRTIPRSYLVEILQPRAEELFTLVKKELTEKGFHGLMNSGVVLTGGASLMEGMDIMAENILELPARIGEVQGVKGTADIVRNPLFVTAAGLALYGIEEDSDDGRPGVKAMVAGIGEKM